MILAQADQICDDSSPPPLGCGRSKKPEPDRVKKYMYFPYVLYG